MPTMMETLLTEHANLLQKIINQAKLDALSTTQPTPVGTGTSVSQTPIVKQDLFTNINNYFSTAAKSGKDKTIVSSFTMTPSLKWTRNNNCWAFNLDLTGMSLGIWGLGGVGGGTLITKKHVLLANHVPYPALPATIYFADKNSNTYQYNIVKTKRVGSSDILIGELDKEVDASLKIYKVLPANFTKYFVKQPMSGEPRFPVAYSDQEKKMLMGDYVSTFVNGAETVMMIAPPVDSDATKYFEELIVGDSGNPVITVINNEPILIGGWYQTRGPSGGWCTPIHAYLSDINNVISSFSVGYKLNEVDLSGFKEV